MKTRKYWRCENHSPIPGGGGANQGGGGELTRGGGANQSTRSPVASDGLVHTALKVHLVFVGGCLLDHGRVVGFSLTERFKVVPCNSVSCEDKS